MTFSYTHYYMGAVQFVENHFVDMTIGYIRLLVDASFC